MLKYQAQMREFAEAYVASRDRVGLPPANAEDVMWARAVEVVLDARRRVDLLTSRDVAAAVRSTQALLQRIEGEAQFHRLVRIVVAHFHRNRARLIEEAVVENRARAFRGHPPVDVREFAVRISVSEAIAPNSVHDGLIVERRTVNAVLLQLGATLIEPIGTCIDPMRASERQGSASRARSPMSTR